MRSPSCIYLQVFYTRSRLFAKPRRLLSTATSAGLEQLSASLWILLVSNILRLTSRLHVSHASIMALQLLSCLFMLSMVSLMVLLLCHLVYESGAIGLYRAVLAVVCQLFGLVPGRNGLASMGVKQRKEVSPADLSLIRFIMRLSDCANSLSLLPSPSPTGLTGTKYLKSSCFFFTH